jgi:hypothetical protein
MQPRVWLFLCATLLGACGSHGDFPFGGDAGTRPDARPRVDARTASDAGVAALPEPTESDNGSVTCATGGRYTVCGAVTEGGATTLSSGETVRGQVGGSHSIQGTRFGIQGGLHVVR